MLDVYASHDRIKNVVYKNGVAVLKLRQKFIDLIGMNSVQINYMNKYAEAYPELVEQINMKTIKFFYDLETTGVKPNKHGIHHISGFIEVNGEIVEPFDFKVAPNPKCVFEDGAMAIGGVTIEEVQAYEGMKTVHQKVMKMLGKYVDRYDAKDKLFLVGYNNRSFDDVFFRAWFEQNGDVFFGSWFWPDSIDVLVLACQYLIDRRSGMKNFRLETVARELGIVIDADRLHTADYDVHLTREIYRIVTGLEIEI